ncbi:MAG: fatty acid desaturase [Pseudomonadota bacterium]
MKPRALPPAANWIRKLSAYREPELDRSLFELAVTVVPFLGLWALALWAGSVHLLLSIPIAVVAGTFLVRLFLIQHDCSHGAFFKSRAANNWTGRVIGAFTLTPYDLWQKSHLIHHASHGNLAKRGIGDVFTLTVDEYNAKSPLGRLGYRLYRNPFVLFILGPIYVFLLHHRLPIGFMKAGPRYWISTMLTNVALLGIIVGGSLAFGWALFLPVYFVITVTAAAIGVWLFYVQHQFEDTIWDHEADWQLHEAALYGSSYLKLPAMFQWMTANIGIHHVHHLYSRIPFYKLHKVIRDHRELAEIRRMNFVDSLKTVRLKLWCDRERRLVPFKVARARRVTAA